MFFLNTPFKLYFNPHFKERTILFHYYSTVAPFYHIRSREGAKYDTLLQCRTGQQHGRKASKKMAGQNVPNFDLFTSLILE